FTFNSTLSLMPRIETETSSDANSSQDRRSGPSTSDLPPPTAPGLKRASPGSWTSSLIDLRDRAMNGRFRNDVPRDGVRVQVVPSSSGAVSNTFNFPRHENAEARYSFVQFILNGTPATRASYVFVVFFFAGGCYRADLDDLEFTALAYYFSSRVD